MSDPTLETSGMVESTDTATEPLEENIKGKFTSCLFDLEPNYLLPGKAPSKLTSSAPANISSLRCFSAQIRACEDTQLPVVRSEQVRTFFTVLNLRNPMRSSISAETLIRFGLRCRACHHSSSNWL